MFILIFTASYVYTRMKSLRTTYRKVYLLAEENGSETLTQGQKTVLDLCSFLENHLQDKRRKHTAPKEKTKVRYIWKCIHLYREQNVKYIYFSYIF